MHSLKPVAPSDWEAQRVQPGSYVGDGPPAQKCYPSAHGQLKARQQIKQRLLNLHSVWPFCQLHQRPIEVQE